MCHYITLIVPNADPAELDRVLIPHGRKAGTVNNPSLQLALFPEDQQFILVRNAALCDCGTIFAAPQGPEKSLAEIHENQAARLRRKGWSASKIERSLAQQSAASKPQEYIDSFEIWEQIVGDIFQTLRVKRVGIFVHNYSGSIAEEVLAPRLRALPAGTSIIDGLKSMTEDEIVLLNANRGGSRRVTG
jgi:hypothetical protein